MSELQAQPQEWPNADFPMIVTEEEDGSLTFEWDEKHPATSVFNGWTEDDFADMLIDACERVLGATDEA